MKQYVVTSNHFTGSLLFKYDEKDCLTGFEIQAVLSDQQKDYFFGNLPRHSRTLLVDWIKKSPTMRVIEMQLDLSFENFWNVYGQAYGEKVGDKPKARKLWSKMSDADKAKAFNIIPRYKLHCGNKGIDMVYPERFLMREYYNNDYRI